MEFSVLLQITGLEIPIRPGAFPEDAPDAAPADAPGPGASSATSWSLDVDDLSLSQVAFALHRPDAEAMQATLEQLRGTLLWDDSLELAFSGRYREIPVSARIEGGSVARLIEGAEAWPLRVDVELAGNPIELAARLATAGDVYRIDDMQGRAGETSVSGWLALENFVTKPRARGRIEVGAIELALPPEPAPQAEDAPAQPLGRLAHAPCMVAAPAGREDRAWLEVFGPHVFPSQWMQPKRGPV